ncbi:MAG TPA: helix-turn-helix transcriptional regulator [Terriglobales bacterium]|nr:helix-turn-helix transcriptional regulator [Terriglobales bacterium]
MRCRYSHTFGAATLFFYRARSHIYNCGSITTKAGADLATNRSLPHAILELRKTLNMSQTELGDRLGVGAMSVSRWERGVIPTADHLIGLAKLSSSPQQFWFFVGKAGLTKQDLVKK